jgi:pimeloyl-ACP methyl ester carboxylesterase
VLPELERHHDVLAPTLPGHAGGPPLPADVTEQALVEWAERFLDAEGIETAHVVGNSLGGYVALQLAERGRARSVVALAPAGGWAVGDPSLVETLELFRTTHALVQTAALHADSIASTAAGRQRATQYIVSEHAHLSPGLVAHQIRGAAACDALPLIDAALRDGYALDAERIDCRVRIVWGSADRLLAWPASATRYRDQWVPNAEWVVLDGAGHSPQLDRPLETAQLILGVTAP